MTTPRLTAQLLVGILVYKVALLTYVLAADGTDYEDGANSVTFDAGSSSGSEECVNVTMIDDNVKEENESFLFVISPGGDGAVVLGISSADVLVTDDDGQKYEI